MIFLHVSTSRVHLQEDGCVYSHGMVRFTSISISGLAGRRECSVLPAELLCTDARKTHYTVPVCKSVFLKMNPRGRNMYKTSKIKIKEFRKSVLFVFIA